ncbi:ATP-binding protein [Thiorhodococcus mannitoliphagus]|uniref:ATP-binding protein n=1 Tax=Thiorhodococcus mannitoliphagus TaxID=329406 RepID=A0A6P1DR62_9GAMM|nr:ATP-binding protein [Thiorhodococcus mannitoliphagus]NEX19643.1 ATP-binding protein [Thiorhodococcus mannitoliphagus]
MSSAAKLITRLETLLERIEQLIPSPELAQPDWSAHAFRWRRNAERGWLQPIKVPQQLAFDDLLCLERQKDEIARNTAQFIRGRPANNVLLWGSRGTGKSSLVKAVFNAHRDAGLRLIEVDKDDLIQLPDILDLIVGRPEPFILFCDDLSFEANESSYKALKAALDGSIAATPENVLIYATSNRRHLLPEFQSENQEARIQDGELHHGESVEEKISLSDRFGLWVSFHPFSQQQYLEVVHHWIARLADTNTKQKTSEWPPIERAALQWALRRGSRSGRTAWQFARDWIGRENQG